MIFETDNQKYVDSRSIKFKRQAFLKNVGVCNEYRRDNYKHSEIIINNIMNATFILLNTPLQ